MDIFLHRNHTNQQEVSLISSRKILMVQVATVSNTSVLVNTGLFVCLMLGRTLSLELGPF